MAPPSILNDYANRHVDSDFLGSIVFVAVRQLAYKWTDVEAKAISVGLDRKFLPNRPGNADLFRRVTKAAQCKKALPDGLSANLLVRDVAKSTTEIVRHLIVETVDAAGRRLDYDAAWVLRFDKTTGILETHKHGFDLSVADTVIPEIRAAFQAEAGTVASPAIRTMINRTLDDNNAVLVRPTGGDYFVPKANVDAVKRLEAFADGLGAVFVHSVPLVDDARQRDWISEAHIDQSTVELDGLIGEANELMTLSEVPVAKLAALTSRYKEIKRRAQAYTDLLSDDIGGVSDRLTVLDMATRQLLLTPAAV